MHALSPTTASQWRPATEADLEAALRAGAEHADDGRVQVSARDWSISSRSLGSSSLHSHHHRCISLASHWHPHLHVAHTTPLRRAHAPPLPPREMLTCVDKAVTHNASEKKVNSLLDFMSQATDIELPQESNETTLQVLPFVATICAFGPMCRDGASSQHFVSAALPLQP
jgi:hypothetical protein